MGQLYYLEDLSVGQRFTSGNYTLDAAELKEFAGRYDPQPFHLDEAAARQSLFGGLAASGWHTAAITMRLNAQGGLPLAGGMVGVSVEIAWPRPVRPGDVLHVESEVLAIAPSRSKPERGLATIRSITFNQKNEIVQTLISKILVWRRPVSA